MSCFAGKCSGLVVGSVGSRLICPGFGSCATKIFLRTCRSFICLVSTVTLNGTEYMSLCSAIRGSLNKLSLGPTRRRKILCEKYESSIC